MIRIAESLEMMAKPSIWQTYRPDFVAIAAIVFQIDARRILSHRKDRNTVMARHAGMWAAREYGYSFTMIGMLFDRDPTSCLHGARRAVVLRTELPWYARNCDAIMERVA